MSVDTPTRVVANDDPQALIEEAWQRTHKRREVRAAVAATVVLVSRSVLRSLAGTPTRMAREGEHRSRAQADLVTGAAGGSGTPEPSLALPVRPA